MLLFSKLLDQVSVVCKKSEDQPNKIIIKLVKLKKSKIV